MDSPQSKEHYTLGELIRGISWRALPFGSNIRETIQDIKVIRESLKRNGRGRKPSEDASREQ